MWRVLLALGLTTLIGGGLYVRSRLTRALEQVGVSPRRVRAVRWAAAWLLWGYPVLQLATTLLMRAFGGASRFSYDGPWATWLLVFPFVIAFLVVVQALPWLLTFGLVRALHNGWRRLRGGSARPSRLSPWLALAFIVGFAIITPAQILLERGALTTRQHRVVVTGSAPTRPATPPFRIAFVSDLQVSANTGPAEVSAFIRRVNGMAADVVLSGGDWINTGEKYIGPAAQAAGALVGRLGTFSVRGDHEHFVFYDRDRSLAVMERALAAQRVPLLADEVRWFDHHGKKIAVLFLNHNYRGSTSADTVARLLAEASSADAKVAVTHQLDERLAALLEDKVDLVLAGHTHGGQIRPLIGLWRAPPVRLETPYINGRYALGSTAVIVTAGMGYSVVPFRYAAKGTVELIELAL